MKESHRLQTALLRRSREREQKQRGHSFGSLFLLLLRELSADNGFLWFLFLPAFIQGVFVTAVVTRPVNSGTGNKPCRTCTV